MWAKIIVLTSVSLAVLDCVKEQVRLSAFRCSYAAFASYHEQLRHFAIYSEVLPYLFNNQLYYSIIGSSLK
jgi:dolichol kinase